MSARASPKRKNSKEEEEELDLSDILEPCQHDIPFWYFPCVFCVVVRLIKKFAVAIWYLMSELLFWTLLAISRRPGFTSMIALVDRPIPSEEQIQFAQDPYNEYEDVAPATQPDERADEQTRLMAARIQVVVSFAVVGTRAPKRLIRRVIREFSAYADLTVEQTKQFESQLMTSILSRSDSSSSEEDSRAAKRMKREEKKKEEEEEEKKIEIVIVDDKSSSTSSSIPTASPSLSYVASFPSPPRNDFELRLEMSDDDDDVQKPEKKPPPPLISNSQESTQEYGC
jgi:hypothetical protein